MQNGFRPQQGLTIMNLIEACKNVDIDYYNEVSVPNRG